MNLLPIVQYKLRSASAKSSTYWWRFAVGFLGAVLLGALLVVMKYLPIVTVRMSDVFGVVRFFALIYCLFSGARLTADCVSEEKRDGTLGFLFLTPLRGYDVILGKLISKGVGPMYTLMVFVPLVWFVSLIGGVSASEQFYTVITLGNTLFFSLAVGITTSTFLTDRRQCELLTSIAVIILFFVVFPLIDPFIASRLGITPFVSTSGSSIFDIVIRRVNTLANPAFLAIGGSSVVIISHMVIHTTSWILIAAASWWAPRCWKERPPAGARLSFREWWMQRIYGTGPARTYRRTVALDANPFFWRATRNRLRPLIPWLFIGLSLGVPLLILGIFGFIAPVFYGLLSFAVIFWYLAPKIWIAREASRTLAEERADGTLEMVLSTPISVREIIQGQWKALRKCYLAAVIFSVCFGLALLFVTNLVPAAKGLYKIPNATPVLIAAMLMLLADCITMGWVGMWYGLKLGNAKKAARSASSVVITFPMLVFAICCFAVAMWSGPQWIPGRSLYVPIGLWLFIGLMFDFILITFSRALLRRDFRKIVQDPTLARDAWARGLGRWFGGMFRKKH